MELKDERDELDQAPTLRRLKGHDPFVVPTGFFDAFPHAVQQRATSRIATDRSVWTLRRAIMPIIATGVIALVVVLISRWSPNATTAPTSPALTLDWTAEELVRSGVDIRSVQTLVGPDEGLMDVVQLPADDNAVLAYLENEDLSIDLLIEEL